MLEFIKIAALLANSAIVATSILIACGADAAPVRVPIGPASWTSPGNVEFVPAQGDEAALLRINIGSATLRNTSFTDGVIEYDVAELPDDNGADFPSIRFRQRDADTAEQLYLRPHAACPTSDDCIQYAPVLHGTLLWDVYPRYQAGGLVRETGWNHVKLVVSGRRLQAFVNHADTPTLVVDELEGEAGAGAIELNGPALYRDIDITPGTPRDLPPAPAAVAEDPRLLRDWQVSAQRFVPPGPMPDYADRPASSWTGIHAERSGLVNLTRLFDAAPRAVGALAWLRTSVVSDRDQRKPVSIGWTREVRVFVNGRPVFGDTNYYYGLPATRRAPDGRLSLENGAFDLPLRRGRNEIAVALDNFFPGSARHGGWGLELRLHDLDGIKLGE